MFDIGWSEMAVVALLALIIIGPKDLPQVLRTVGQWVRKAQSLAREFRSGLDDMVREADLEDAKKLVDEGRRLNVNKIVEQTIDPTGGVRKEAEALQGAVQDDKPAGGQAAPAEEEAPAKDKADGAAAPVEEETPQAAIVRHPLRVAPPHSITPPPEPKAKAEPKSKPKAEPKSKPKAEPKSKPKAKPKSKAVEAAMGAAGEDGSQKTA